MQYRPEIDGLRAIAVVPVILFHAGFGFASGGFVGVDVFFVISGFLITSIIVQDIEAGRFSIVDFYERRARRILPALFLVLLASSIAAWNWLLPQQMDEYSASMVATSLFVSNFYYLLQIDYFAPDAETLPLLHTWSLAVEEQYYVAFPIALFFIWRLGVRNVFVLLKFVAIASLAVSEAAARSFPAINFYGTQSRIWELMAGGLTALLVRSRKIPPNEYLAFASIVMVAIAVIMFDKTTPFPGIYALVPVIGTVGVISYAQNETRVGRLLASAPFVAIGLISYSAYLWHQPLFAFARMRTVDEPSKLAMTGLSTLALVLAYFSWRYIEAPFRDRRRMSRRTIFISAGLMILLPVAFGVAGAATNGFERLRFNEEERRTLATIAISPKRADCHFPQAEEALSRPPCKYFHSDAPVAVIGNSHATELAYAVAEGLRDRGLGIVQHSISGCRHNFDLLSERITVCGRWHEKVVRDVIADERIRYVVLSYMNDKYLANQSYRLSLIRMIQRLQAEGKVVILVLQAPRAVAPVAELLQASWNFANGAVVNRPRAQWDRVYAPAKQLVAALPKDVIVVDPADRLCDSGNCYAARDGTVYYFDSHHMSLPAAEMIAREVVQKMDL